MSAERPALGRRPPLGEGLTVGQLLAITIGLLLALAAAGIAGALIASGIVAHQRSLLLDKVAPSLRAELELETALLNQETGVRGYIISGDPSFLEPFHEGQAREAESFAALEARAPAVGAPVGAEISAVRDAVAAWKSLYVLPELRRVSRSERRAAVAPFLGKTYFDAVRRTLSPLQTTLTRKDARGRTRLNGAAEALTILLVVVGCLILGSILAAGYILRRTITRPLAALGSGAAHVAGGEFGAALPSPSAPREIASLSRQIEKMRRRIVHELEAVQRSRKQLEQQARELARSNAELEQFAYVASHDLQEPLRKVASFCQALQTRYHGQLDERADQYIDFAVDGAKRMQKLINDLLAFSRVGRGEHERRPVELSSALAGAESALEDALHDADARITAGTLPAVMGDATLLCSVFQNLIANALKFRGPEPPQVRIAAERNGGDWLISCEDNGIGIDAEYAERIFLIFQRLHTREAYAGSGIGLALCRKIVEYHGGHIWLDTHYTHGARFCFTLPAAEEATN